MPTKNCFFLIRKREYTKQLSWVYISKSTSRKYNYLSYTPTVRGKKKVGKSIRISQRLFNILPNALGSKEAKYPSFFQKIFECPFAPLRYFFYPFLICGLLKKGQICTSEVKNDDNSKFFENNYPRFFVQVYMADADFRQKFLTKILNPQMGILTQSQIIFWENSNFQNRLKLTNFDPRWKKNFFLKNPTTILTSTNLS